MTINSKLLEQDSLISKQAEIINKIKDALKAVMKKEGLCDACADKDSSKSNESLIALIVDSHNARIENQISSLENILNSLDLEI